jgi:hypothetical protein
MRKFHSYGVPGSGFCNIITLVNQQSVSQSFVVLSSGEIAVELHSYILLIFCFLKLSQCIQNSLLSQSLISHSRSIFGMCAMHHM